MSVKIRKKQIVIENNSDKILSVIATLILLTIPITTSESEHCFSMSNRIKIKYPYELR